jgi:hypothetical protein
VELPQAVWLHHNSRENGGRSGVYHVNVRGTPALALIKLAIGVLPRFSVVISLANFSELPPWSVSPAMSRSIAIQSRRELRAAFDWAKTYARHIHTKHRAQNTFTALMSNRVNEIRRKCHRIQRRCTHSTAMWAMSATLRNDKYKQKLIFVHKTSE